MHGPSHPYFYPQDAVYPQTLFSSKPPTATASPPSMAMQTFDSEPRTSGDSASSRVTTNKVKSKSADWTVNESKDLIRAWGPHYEKLKGVSNKDRTRIWNEIYEGFRNKRQQDNGRVLPQVKK